VDPLAVGINPTTEDKSNTVYMKYCKEVLPTRGRRIQSKKDVSPTPSASS